MLERLRALDFELLALTKTGFTNAMLEAGFGMHQIIKGRVSAGIALLDSNPSAEVQSIFVTSEADDIHKILGTDPYAGIVFFSPSPAIESNRVLYEINRGEDAGLERQYPGSDIRVAFGPEELEKILISMPAFHYGTDLVEPVLESNFEVSATIGPISGIETAKYFANKIAIGLMPGKNLEEKRVDAEKDSTVGPFQVSLEPSDLENDLWEINFHCSTPGSKPTILRAIEFAANELQEKCNSFPFVSSGALIFERNASISELAQTRVLFGK